MKPAQAAAPGYDARIRRAQYLAAQYPFAAEVLVFYQQLAAFQKNLYTEISHNWSNQSVARPQSQLRAELPVEILLPHFPEFLSVLARIGPSPVADDARRLSARTSVEWIGLLTDFWSFSGCSVDSGQETLAEPRESLQEFILRAFLQPYSEFLAARTTEPQLETTSRVCPRCGSAPLLGVLHPEGDGGKRCLLCSFCLHEWDFRRILCPACGEEAEGKLPVYVAEQFPHIRVETCETCRCYLRTIDLTKNGHAVPIVDDLAAIPLSLWAHEHGYTRLHPNLLGI
jgi:FdhE protein